MSHNVDTPRNAAAKERDQVAGKEPERSEPLKLGVLISGSGTNLQALIDAIAAGQLNATIEMVVSSRPSAFGLQRAREAGIQTLTLSPDIYAEPAVADMVIATELKRAGVELVVLAGYMRKVGLAILLGWEDRVVNLHPALLPSFPGAHAIVNAFERGVKVTGVTVHIANEDYDAGPIVAQEPVRVQEGWTVNELEAHIHEVEHKLLPATIQLFAQGRVHVRPDRTVHIDERPQSPQDSEHP